jgi:UDP-2,3-diacylglucosamine pyrophosphatase LpxH
MIDGILYCNDGDWVESLTALVESPTGQLEILHWTSSDATEDTPLAATAVAT